MTRSLYSVCSWRFFTKRMSSHICKAAIPAFPHRTFTSHYFMKIQSSKLWILLALAALSFASSAVQAQQPLISPGAVWKYFDTGTLPDPVWMTPSYDDTLWPSGPAELGYGDGGEATTNAAGFITYYYRTTFPVATASSVSNLLVRLKRDDGAVVYINGVEAFRDNMPAGPVDASTLAASTASDDGQTFQIHNLSASGL